MSNVFLHVGAGAGTHQSVAENATEVTVHVFVMMVVMTHVVVDLVTGVHQQRVQRASHRHGGKHGGAASRHERTDGERKDVDQDQLQRMRVDGGRRTGVRIPVVVSMDMTPQEAVEVHGTVYAPCRGFGQRVAQSEYGQVAASSRIHVYIIVSVRV